MYSARKGTVSNKSRLWQIRGEFAAISGAWLCASCWASNSVGLRLTMGDSTAARLLAFDGAVSSLGGARELSHDFEAPPEPFVHLVTTAKYQTHPHPHEPLNNHCFCFTTSKEVWVMALVPPLTRGASASHQWDVPSSVGSYCHRTTEPPRDLTRGGSDGLRDNVYISIHIKYQHNPYIYIYIYNIIYVISIHTYIHTYYSGEPRPGWPRRPASRVGSRRPPHTLIVCIRNVLY